MDSESSQIALGLSGEGGGCKRCLADAKGKLPAIPLWSAVVWEGTFVTGDGDSPLVSWAALPTLLSLSALPFLDHVP